MKNIKKIIIVLILILLTFSITSFFLNENSEHYERDKELLNTFLVNEAKKLYDIMVVTRVWNAQHEGIYADNDSLKPNPYLLNNTLKTEDNKTLIKINAAWMTRQISDVASHNSDYFYRISSLRPKDPDNRPDSFEKEALEHFDKNKSQKYYYKPFRLDSEDKYFNLMGSLLVDKSCLECHNVKENKIGDVRGGIRVSIPTKIYKKTYDNITSYKENNDVVIITFSIITLVALIFSVLFFLNYQERIENLNFSLKRKVDERTKELYELNKELENRVQKAVQEIQEKEKLMIMQAKSAAMGEMISMIAHQWRQPLSEISMINNNLMAEILLENYDVKYMTESIESSFEIIEHLSKTIDDFVNFFKQTKSKEKFILDELIKSVLDILHGVLEKNNINVRLKSTEKIELYTYERELLHVVLNIINNSKDAFLEKEIDLENRFIDINTKYENDFVVITICDNAQGIKEENLASIFDPYFSTKSKNGSGLGLYISKVIIENHIGGKLDIYNFKDGACCEIQLPNKGHLT